MKRYTNSQKWYVDSARWKKTANSADEKKAYVDKIPAEEFNVIGNCLQRCTDNMLRRLKIIDYWKVGRC